jgi:flagellar biosynthesis/type III secretory pathway protein FliH
LGGNLDFPKKRGAWVSLACSRELTRGLRREADKGFKEGAEKGFKEGGRQGV